MSDPGPVDHGLPDVDTPAARAAALMDPFRDYIEVGPGTLEPEVGG